MAAEQVEQTNTIEVNDDDFDIDELLDQSLKKNNEYKERFNEAVTLFKNDIKKRRQDYDSSHLQKV